MFHVFNYGCQLEQRRDGEPVGALQFQGAVGLLLSTRPGAPPPKINPGGGQPRNVQSSLDNTCMLLYLYCWYSCICAL